MRNESWERSPASSTGSKVVIGYNRSVHGHNMKNIDDITPLWMQDCDGLITLLLDWMNDQLCSFLPSYMLSIPCKKESCDPTLYHRCRVLFLHQK